MIISKSKIMKVPSGLDANKQYFVSAIADEKVLSKLGLNEFKEGVVIQPPIECGIVSKRNIFGYSIPNKELPKEERFIRTIYWEWQLYNGDWESDYKDIYKKCYPRIEYEPFGIEMKSIIINNTKMFITKVEDFNDLKNIINLYLEVFGYCEILNDDLKLTNLNSNYNRCNWEILPPDIKINIQKSKIKSRMDKDKYKKDYDQERINTLEGYNPKEKFIGKNGFQGYYAFLYNNICVLESPLYGNATYIVPINNWKDLSKMTKKELINSGYLLDRFEHNKKWFDDIKRKMQ